MSVKSGAFIFLFLSTLLLFVLWCWNIFGSGAKHWEKSILKIHGDKYRFISHPIIAKSASTILLLAFLFSFVLLFLDSSYK